MSNIFRGFSTANRVRAPYSLTGNDLIKQDLINEFYTRRGERVMRPNYGTKIWELLMDPNDALTQQEIKEDVERICNKDPRVKFDQVNLIVMDRVIRVEVQLTYLPFYNQDTLYLEYITEAGEI